MLAAYCVSANLGKPYTSGLCSGDYVKNRMAAAQTGIAVENYRPAQRASTDLFQVFQCSAKGTKLAFRGCLMLINSYKKRDFPMLRPPSKPPPIWPRKINGAGKAVSFLPWSTGLRRTAARRGWLDDPTRVTAHGLVSRPFRRIQHAAAAKKANASGSTPCVCAMPRRRHRSAGRVVRACAQPRSATGSDLGECTPPSGSARQDCDGGGNGNCYRGGAIPEDGKRGRGAPDATRGPMR